MNAKGFIAPGSSIFGDVLLGTDVSVWFNAVIRTEAGSIKIGDKTNIQDNCVLHTDNGLVIGKGVTIGHGAVVHCSKIGDNSLIGMGSVLLEGSVIGNNCVIGAGAVIRENEKIPDNSVVIGVPGKVIRKVKDDEIRHIENNASHYIDLSKEYISGKFKDFSV